MDGQTMYYTNISYSGDFDIGLPTALPSADNAVKYEVFADNASNMLPTENKTIATNTSEDVTYWQTSVAHAIFTYFPPFIVVLGTFGNVVSFLVSRRRSMKRCSVGFCLSVLAISDLLVLYVGVTRNWSKQVFKWDVRYEHEIFCKLQRFLLYFSLDYSAWILVTITVERFISVCYPFKANSLCTVSRTKKILIIIAATIAVENIGVFFARGREVTPSGNGTKVNECGFTSDTSAFYWRKVRPWNVIVLYAVIPFGIMIFCSIRIVWRLRKARKEMSALFGSEVKGQSTQCLDRLQVPNGNPYTTKENQKSAIKRSTRLKTHLESYRMYSMTIMSLVVAVVFLLLVTPSHLEFFLEVYWDKKDAYDFARFEVIEAFTRTLLYSNHAINFFVYMASGRKFRREFKAMIFRESELSSAASTSQAYNSVYANIRNMTARTYIDRSPGRSPMLNGRRGVVI